VQDAVDDPHRMLVVLNLRSRLDNFTTPFNKGQLRSIDHDLAGIFVESNKTEGVSTSSAEHYQDIPSIRRHFPDERLAAPFQAVCGQSAG
jgi:hypothetical protein